MFKLINTTPIKAKEKCNKLGGIAELNKNNIEEIKDFGVCLSKKINSFKFPIFQIGYDEGIKSHASSNFEKVIYVYQDKELKKDKIPKKLVVEKLYLFCTKNQKNNFLRISMIVLITICSVILAIVVYTYRKDIYVSLYNLRNSYKKYS